MFSKHLLLLHLGLILINPELEAMVCFYIVYRLEELFSALTVSMEAIPDDTTVTSVPPES